MLKKCRLNNCLTALIFVGAFSLNALFFPKLLELEPLTFTETVRAAPFVNNSVESSGPNSNMLQAEGAMETVLEVLQLPGGNVWNGFADYMDAPPFSDQAIWRIRFWQNDSFHYYAIVSADDGELLLCCYIEYREDGMMLLHTLNGQPVSNDYTILTNYTADYTIRIDDSGTAHITKQGETQ